jgi:drug/metabolite transporter (DMT)-like permease
MIGLGIGLLVFGGIVFVMFSMLLGVVLILGGVAVLAVGITQNRKNLEGGKQRR